MCERDQARLSKWDLFQREQNAQSRQSQANSRGKFKEIQSVMELSGFYGTDHRHCMTAAKPFTRIQLS